MPHVIIEHYLSHDYTPAFFFGTPQSFRRPHPGERTPHHSHFTSPQIRRSQPGGPDSFIQGAYVTPKALFDLKLMQMAEVLRLYANPMIASDEPDGSENDQHGQRVAPLNELLERMGRGQFYDQATGASKAIKVAFLDDGINKTALESRMHAKDLPAPKYAEESLCQLPELPSPFSQTDPSHGGMCAFDACIFGTDIELMDFPINALQSGTRIVEALAVLVHLTSLLRTGEIERLVVVNAWHTCLDDENEGTKTDDIGHIFNQQLLLLEDRGADILFSTPSHGLNATKTIHGPAGNPAVLCVAAVDLDMKRRQKDAKGPGTMGVPKPDITTFTAFDGYNHRNGRDEGTSAATGLLAGVVAAMRSQGYSGSPQQLRELLGNNAAELGDADEKVLFGAGLVDAVKTLSASHS